MVQTGSTRPCVFCGEIQKLTKEHLFRDSLGGRIPASPGLARLRTNSTGLHERTDMPVSIFDVEVRAVCGPCNNGWMNDIDARIEDLLIGLANGWRHDIPAAHLADVSRWATRIALLRTLSERTQSGHAKASQFHEFFESQLPPHNTFIRVARLPHLAFEGGANSFARLGSADITSPDQGDSLNIVSWGIGLLFVHVVLASAGAAATAAHQVDRAIRNMGKTMPRVWPGPRRSVTLTSPADPVTLDHLSSVRFMLFGAKPAPGPNDA